MSVIVLFYNFTTVFYVRKDRMSKLEATENFPWKHSSMHKHVKHCISQSTCINSKNNVFISQNIIYWVNNWKQFQMSLWRNTILIDHNTTWRWVTLNWFHCRWNNRNHETADILVRILRRHFTSSACKVVKMWTVICG